MKKTRGWFLRERERIKVHYGAKTGLWDAQRDREKLGGITEIERESATKMLWSTKKVSRGILDGIEKKNNALFWERRS